MSNKPPEKIPPFKLWKDTKKAPPGPNELQRRYFITKMPPDKRPHWHTQDVVVSIGGQGSGKSFRKGTPVLAFDGSIVKIEDIKVGDLLMGPDSTPRKVLELGRGRETFYKIIPTKGEPFYCNESHILSLKRSTNVGDLKWISPEGIEYRKPNPRYPGPDIVNVSVKEYLSWSKRKKGQFLLYRSSAIKFPKPKASLPISPYTLGLWLGDGDSVRCTITNIDKEIIDYLIENGFEDYCEQRKGRDHIYRLKAVPLNKKLKDLNLISNKHIPIQYKCGSIEVRRQLLAGLIDSDGYVKTGSLDITQKSKVLAEDIAFVARSLGLAAYISECQKSCPSKEGKFTGTYYRLSISGDLDQIPVKLPRKQSSPRKQKKSVLVTGFKLERLPEDDYYGVVLDGDHLFLLGDFTVVHNSHGGVVLLMDTAINVPGASVYLAGMDYKLLKRNTWGIIRDICTIKVPWDHPGKLNRLHDQNSELNFTNTSKLVCINLEQNLAKKIGYTADIQMIDEAHLLPDENAYNLLVGRARGTAVEIRQLILCTNPEKTKDGWMNVLFELHKFDGIDTSEAPVEMLVGPSCTCHLCDRCTNTKKEFSWIETEEGGLKCSTCGSLRDYWTWKGKKYHCPGNQQYTRVIKSESFHNPHLPSDYFQGMKATYDENYYNIMVKGQLNTNLRDDYCYKKYNSDIHELDLQIPINWDEDLYWGLDFNVKPQSSVICQFEDYNSDEKLIVKEEIRLSGKPTVEYPNGSGEGATALDVAKYFVDKYKKQYKGTTIHIYGDPKAFTNTATSSQNAFEIICEYLEEKGFSVNLVADKHQISVKDRLALVDYWLDEQKILFNPSSVLPWTTKSFAESKLDENDGGKGEKVSKKQDYNASRSTNMNRVYCVSHFNEALGYLVWKLLPMAGMVGRSATLPDGTTIREDKRGKVIVEKSSIVKDAEEGTWEHALQQLKTGKEELAPTSLRGMGLKIPCTRFEDDNGL